MPKKSKNDFDELVNSIYQTHCVLQENAAKAINYNLTVRNWLIGCYIVEFEQNGEDRAKYGTSLLEEIANKLKNKGLKGFSISALKNHRTFYLYYPQISQSVIGELELAPVLAERLNNRLTLTSESNDSVNLPSELLLSRLSYTHFIELIKRNIFLHFSYNIVKNKIYLNLIS